ncbi:MAG: RNA-binding S4 domain-containing protein [Clostridiales bacterium]|nr:RNA-binding S4 domain-containing protein [Candidatus Crickella merdequi]
MRLDKFLKNSRIIKRRTVAKDACEQGRVEVNGKIAKPGLELKVGDVIKVTFGTNELQVSVKALIDSCKKDDAEKMYEVINQ